MSNTSVNAPFIVDIEELPASHLYSGAFVLAVIDSEMAMMSQLQLHNLRHIRDDHEGIGKSGSLE